MKRVAATPDPHVVRIPLVVGMPVVRIQAQAIVVVFEVEQLQIAVGILDTRTRPPGTPSFEDSQD